MVQRFVVAVSLAAVLAVGLPAQAAGNSLTVDVTGNTGAATSSATVKVYSVGAMGGDSPSLLTTVSTDQFGRVVIADLPGPAYYKVCASAPTFLETCGANRAHAVGDAEAVAVGTADGFNPHPMTVLRLLKRVLIFGKVSDQYGDRTDQGLCISTIGSYSSLCGNGYGYGTSEVDDETSGDWNAVYGTGYTETPGSPPRWQNVTFSTTFKAHRRPDNLTYEGNLAWYDALPIQRITYPYQPARPPAIAVRGGAAPAVGEVLEVATAGTWTFAPARVTHWWLRDGEVIDPARTDSQFYASHWTSRAVQPEDAGHDLVYRACPWGSNDPTQAGATWNSTSRCTDSNPIRIAGGSIDTAAGAFTAVSPSRLLDTRNGIGAAKAQVGAGKTVTFQVSGRAGVPASDAAAAVLNVTATRSAAAGSVTAFPGGTSRPATSNVSFARGQTISAHTTIKLGADGKVSLFNGSSASVDLIADVTGWYRGGSVTEPGMFTPVQPARLASTVTTAANGALPVAVADRGGIPATGVGAATFSVTASAPTKNGYLTAYPSGDARPNASNVNFLTGQTITNAATTKLGSDGRLAVFNGAAGTTRITADVSGWFKSGTPTAAGSFTPLVPARILDTRNGIGAPAARIGAGKTLTLTVAGAGGAPASGLGAAVLNVTVTRPGAGGYVTAYPAGTARPNASNLNFVANQTVPNLVTVKVSDGKASFYNGATQPIDLIADLAGWYRE